MDLIKESKRRKEYQEEKIKELKECFGKVTTLEARRYITEEIAKSEKNKKYYSEILEKLEGI